MKARKILLAALIINVPLFAGTSNNPTNSNSKTENSQESKEVKIAELPPQNKLPVKKLGLNWLSGDQPKLLTAMANSETTRESLDGSSRNLKTIVGGWHAQAIGQYKNFIYVGFSDGKLTSDKVPAANKNPKDFAAKLWIYNTKTKEGKLIELEKGYPHPCSIQVSGKYLTIAIEAEYGISQAALGSKRQERSMALIFDLNKDPNCGVEVSRVVQDGMNSGGAGLTYSPKMKCWYMLMDQDKSTKGRVAIYKTKNKNINSWEKEPIARYKRFGAGAGLNLVTASDNSIWGLWYDSSHENLPTFSKFQMAGDQVKLFKLIQPDGKPVKNREVFTQIVNIESPKLEQVGELLADRPGMRFGAGLRYENGKLELLTCQRNMNEKFNINRTKITLGKRTQVMFVNLSRSRAEINCSSLTNKSESYNEKKIQSQSWNKTLQSPIKADVNYQSASSISSGFGSLSSIGKWTDAIEKQSSAPLVLFYLEGTSDIKGGMIEFKAKKEIDQKK
ncbi:MAG: hypothetical protein ABJF11_19650 [Reichenbachiella sp.]|uniref:hypothetical protein n=1 Tax=Reichenbachiella sp. TaxID=2184521 RepID=UPI00326793A5